MCINVESAAVEQQIQSIMDSPQTSYWLKQALESSLQRDCNDAANDAETLRQLLVRRCEVILEASTS